MKNNKQANKVKRYSGWAADFFWVLFHLWLLEVVLWGNVLSVKQANRDQSDEINCEAEHTGG